MISACLVPCVVLKLSDLLDVVSTKLFGPKGLELYLTHPCISGAGIGQEISEGLRELNFF